jgi:uncharacterized membrane protein
MKKGANNLLNDLNNTYTGIGKLARFGVNAFLIILFLRCLYWVPSQLIKGKFGFTEMFWLVWVLAILVGLVFVYFKVKETQKKEIEKKKELAKKYSWYQPKDI